MMLIDPVLHLKCTVCDKHSTMLTAEWEGAYPIEMQKCKHCGKKAAQLKEK